MNMNKNKKAKPEIKFIEKKYKNSIRYYIVVDNEYMRVTKTRFEKERSKYLRIKKSEK